MSRVFGSLLRSSKVLARRSPAVLRLRPAAARVLATPLLRATLATAAPAAAASAASAKTKSNAAADPDRAKAIIAANTVPKPAVTIHQTIFKSAVLDVPIAKAWDGIRAFAGTWIPDSTIALAPDHKSDGTHNVIGHKRIVTVVPLKKRLVEQLVGYNELKRSYTYRTLAVEAGIFPANYWDYVGTVRLYEITEGAKTLATWSADYEVEPGPAAAQLYTALGDSTLAANLVAFGQYIASKK